MRSLRAGLSAAPSLDGLAIRDRTRALRLRDLAAGTALDVPPGAVAGRSVLLAVRDQASAAAAMIALDGLAARLVLAPRDLTDDQLAAVGRDAGIELVVAEEGRTVLAGLPHARVAEGVSSTDAAPVADSATEWVLATSGTTGAPKLVVHTLAGLAGAIDPAAAPAPGTVWSTFYDIRRYGGLQVFLRAMLGPTSLVLSDPAEAPGDYLRRAATSGVTHILGTPSHWRRALMSPALAALSPRYVRLSGEIADQAILDRLRAAFPQAAVAHAYASTEGGVGFSVDDGREGFPASCLGVRQGIEIVVRDETLHVRSARTGRRYLGDGAEALVGADGFVDTGDRVERRGERYHFLGRASGLVNVGGAKVQPEEVEAVINAEPGVATSRVGARRNAILGALVAAEVVPRDPGGGTDALREAILGQCRAALAPHKVPARIVFVESLPLSAGGKLQRGPA